ncbi:MAG: DinB family protein [Micromonosporaceae bacterium]
MTWIAPEVHRSSEPQIAGERAMLEGWLDWQRQTLLWKCAGLTGEQLTRQTAPPSQLCLLALVRHMAEVERGWFRRRFAGQEIGPLFCVDASPDGDFEDIDPATAEADFAAFAAECAAAREATGGASLEATIHHPRRGELSLRWIYIHMIEEYARHNGHADLLREAIDGATGR